MASETMEKPEFSERKEEGSSTQQAGAHPGIRGEMVCFGHQDGLLKCVNKAGAELGAAWGSEGLRQRGTNSSRAGREPDYAGFKSGLLGADKAALVECACGLS